MRGLKVKERARDEIERRKKGDEEKQRKVKERGIYI